MDGFRDPWSLWASFHQGYQFGGPHNEDDSLLGSILGPPIRESSDGVVAVIMTCGLCFRRVADVIQVLSIP